MSRESNIAVIRDTLRLCQEHPALAEAVRTSIAGQRYIPQSADLIISAPAGPKGAKILVSPKRSYEAASGYRGKRVAVLNFASAVSPGGGVLSGANAQEEALCRISTLYPCLAIPEAADAFYIPHKQANNRLNTDDCIFTPGVVVFKTDDANPQLLPESEWYTVDVITCAAPDLRLFGAFGNPTLPTERLHALHTQRLRRILDVAVANGAEVVILGAFGCGAFANDPQVVAKAMAAVTAEYRQRFDVIEYAVYCPPGRDENFRAFCEAMQPMMGFPETE